MSNTGKVVVGRVVRASCGGYTFRVDSQDLKLLLDLKGALVKYADVISISCEVERSGVFEE